LLRLKSRFVAEDVRAMAVHKKLIKNLKTKVDGYSGEESRAKKLRHTGCDVLDPATIIRPMIAPSRQGSLLPFVKLGIEL
jgi:hypothetical protein